MPITTRVGAASGSSIAPAAAATGKSIPDDSSPSRAAIATVPPGSSAVTASRESSLSGMRSPFESPSSPSGS